MNKNNKIIWPIGLTVVIAVFLAFILGVITIAVRNKPQLVSEHYYSEGYNLKEIVDKQNASEATGWKLKIVPPSTEYTDTPILQIQVLEANDTPCDSLHGDIALYRPSDKTLDIPSMSLRVMGAGKYFVMLPRILERGAWQAVVRLSRQQQEFQQRQNLFVENNR
jgi:nitrogen fixation protein FixH